MERAREVGVRKVLGAATKKPYRAVSGRKFPVEPDRIFIGISARISFGAMVQSTDRQPGHYGDLHLPANYWLGFAAMFLVWKFVCLAFILHLFFRLSPNKCFKGSF